MEIGEKLNILLSAELYRGAVLPAGHQEKIWPAAWETLSTAEYVIPGQQMGGVFLS